MKLEQWLEDVAAKQPTPGGGAAAGLAAAVAAALVGMVSGYTTGPKWQERESEMLVIHGQAAELRLSALGLMAADEAAFAEVGKAYGLSKDTEAQKTARQAAIQAALVAAAEPPKQIAVLATEIIALAANLVNSSNPNVLSDVAVAASFARTAVEAAAVNIEINEQALRDEKVKAELRQAVAACASAIAQADSVIAAVRQKVAGSA